MEIAAGVQLGSYHIISLLGKGGMGEVYRAHDSRLKRDVAIKILPDRFSADADRVSRFQREAEILASFNHPNIAAIHDLQEAHGLRFLVLELVEGDTLAERMARGLLPIDDVLRLASEIADALGAAHEKGVVHRDLKPGNVKIGANGQVKVLDFGLATAPRDDRMPLSASPTQLMTEVGVIAGTMAYMSPEQAAGRRVDARSDVFSFGLVLYEMLAGHHPFEGSSGLGYLHAITHDAPPPLRRLRAEAPASLCALVEKAIEKDPADRYQSFNELAVDLRRLTRQSVQGAAAYAAATNNLPIQTTSFVGRASETAGILQSLSRTRLLTLTGAGGTGKTRLALEAGSRMLEDYPEGVWFVELAPLADPSLVPQAVAAALGVRTSAARSITAALHDHLQDRHLLLILDNCEHLVQACAQFVDGLLHTCPAIRVLATSREALGIGGEISWPVSSMKTPEGETFSAAHIADVEAVRLFSERARAVKADFQVTDANAESLAQICRRLDGIPLAIELAAARVRMFSIEQIAGRLDDRFRLLTGGSRTALPRQQTLRSLIDWSYGLLSDSERVLLRRLSVFAGGWTYEATEAVCEGNGIDADSVLDLLGRLVDKSLVIAAEHRDEVRYRLLETIRQYARDRLLESGEGEISRGRHLDFYVRLTESAERKLWEHEQAFWFDRLEEELDNLRAALDWASGTGAVVAGLRLLGASYMFWWLRGHSHEGLHRTRGFLARPEAARPSVARAKGLFACAFLEGWVHDNSQAARPLLEEAAALATDLGDKPTAFLAQIFIAAAALRQGDYEVARSLLESSKAFARDLNDDIAMGQVLLREGDLPFLQEEYQRAKTNFEASVAHLRKHRDNIALSYSLRRLGQAELELGDPDRAADRIRESLRINWELRDHQAVAACVAASAAVAMARGHTLEATRLFAAAEAVLRRIRSQLLYIDQIVFDRNLAALHARIEPETFDAAWAEGQALTIEQSIDLAMKASFD